jgi:hypothetical protein
MERSRLDQVYVNVAGDVVEIAWAERDWLLEKIRVVAGFETIVQKFEAVGASMPVDLDFDERARLRTPLEFWGELPDGLARLLDALVGAAPGGHANPPRFNG